MPDIRELFNSPYLGHWDLIGKDGKHLTVKLTIDHIETGVDLDLGGGQKKTSSIAHFRPYVSANGRTKQVKPLVLNSQRILAIASHHGTDYDRWAGKEVLLTVGEAKSPPKWMPIYGPKMPSVFVKPKERGKQLVEQLKAAKDEPLDTAFDDAPVEETREAAQREPGSDDQ